MAKAEADLETIPASQRITIPSPAPGTVTRAARPGEYRMVRDPDDAPRRPSRPRAPAR